MICHGAGSAKESHFDFAPRLPRARARRAGLRRARPRALRGRVRARRGRRRAGDVRRCCASTRPPWRCAARAWAASARSSPRRATPTLVRGRGDLPGARGRCSARTAGGPLGPSSARRRRRPPLARVARRRATPSRALGAATALLLLHARGDEQVPYAVSEELHAAAHEPKRLIVVPGGHHRSLQHDLEMQSGRRGTSSSAPQVRSRSARRLAAWPPAVSCRTSRHRRARASWPSRPLTAAPVSPTMPSTRWPVP